MPSSFPCPQCGRQYAFRPELVGKRAKCSTCGLQFPIVAPADAAPIPVARPLPPAPEAARPVPAPSEPLRPIPVAAPAAEDGADWLDSMTAPGASSSSTGSGPAAPRPVSVLQKRKSRSGADWWSSPELWKVGIGGIVLVVAVVAGIIATARSTSATTEVVDELDKLTKMLSRVQDVKSAQRERANIEAQVSRYIKCLRENKDVKVNDANGRRLEEAVERFGRELARAMTIPGVQEVLGPSITRLGNAATEVAKDSHKIPGRPGR